MTRVPFWMSSALVSRVLVTLIRMRDKSDWRSRLKCFGLYEPSMGVDNTGRRYDDEKSVAQLLSRESLDCPDKRPSGSIYARPLVGEAFSRGQSNQNSFHWKNKTFPFLFSSPFYQETDRTARQIGDGRENKQITKTAQSFFSFFLFFPPRK